MRRPDASDAFCGCCCLFVCLFVCFAAVVIVVVLCCVVIVSSNMSSHSTESRVVIAVARVVFVTVGINQIYITTKR